MSFTPLLTRKLIKGTLFYSVVELLPIDTTYKVLLSGLLYAAHSIVKELHRAENKKKGKTMLAVIIYGLARL